MKKRRLNETEWFLPFPNPIEGIGILCEKSDERLLDVCEIWGVRSQHLTFHSLSDVLTIRTGKTALFHYIPRITRILTRERHSSYLDQITSTMDFS